MNYLEDARISGLVGGHGVFRFLLNADLGCHVETNKIDNWEYLTITMIKVKNKKVLGGISRYPTLREQQHIKQLFYGDKVTVFSIYPKKDKSFIVRPWTAVIWVPVDQEIELPETQILGFGLNDPNKICQSD